MDLDALIKTLESASELATGGDCHASIAEDGGETWLGVGVEWMVGPNGAEMLIDEAQAIAIRHNTAAQVISELKTQRARADRAEARVGELEADRQTPAIAPNPFRLNPVCGTMGYVLMLAQYDGDLDEWILEDDGRHHGWRTASLIEPTTKGPPP